MRLVELCRNELPKYQKWYQQIDYRHLEDAGFSTKNLSVIGVSGGYDGFYGTYISLIDLENILLPLSYAMPPAQLENIRRHHLGNGSLCRGRILRAFWQLEVAVPLLLYVMLFHTENI